MSITHPIGDLVARIKNGQGAGKEKIAAPFSALKAAILDVLKDEGFISDWKKIPVGENKFDLEIDLKYVDGNGAIREISIVSKPGRRAYFNVEKMPRVMNGLGVAIVSTPRGVMTDVKARIQNVGGEVLCRVV
ncbi:MAG: 30S ribosomal protein S8 [Rickettsiales bacterium]|jgi:small subunit ribosomal protein S8|nr:30S ribosomal protein S8 [Rickettsiales bacterium]